jgi:phosphoribosylanthranilate isomerase
MAIIKICGLSTAPTLEAALEAGADMVGFVFFERSPRHVDMDRAAVLGRQTEGRARKVALTVDAPDALLDRVCLALRPDVLQLHGREPPERVAAVRRRLGLPVIKALGVSTAADLAAVRSFADVADTVLLDAKPPPGATLPGGNGVAFDWTILGGLDRTSTVMLSGGLDAGNVADAVRIARPSGVDVSSGVEDAPGVKNPDKIRAFVAAARAAFARALQEEESP